MNRLSVTPGELVHLSSDMASSALDALQTATAETKRFARFICFTCETSDSPAGRQRTPSEAESLKAAVYAKWAREDSASPIHAPPPAAPPPLPEPKAFISEKPSRRSCRRSPQAKDTALPASASSAESPTLVTSPTSASAFPSTPPTSLDSPASAGLSVKLDRWRDGQPSPHASHTCPTIRSRGSQKTELNAAREEAMATLIRKPCGAGTIRCPRHLCEDELKDVEALASHLHIHIVDEQVCLAGASARPMREASTRRSRARTTSATPLRAFTGPFRRLAALAVCHRADAGTSD